MSNGFLFVGQWVSSHCRKFYFALARAEFERAISTNHFPVVGCEVQISPTCRRVSVTRPECFSLRAFRCFGGRLRCQQRSWRLSSPSALLLSGFVQQFADKMPYSLRWDCER